MVHEHPTYGNGKICYLELPAIDINESAIFYNKVFGWQVRKRSDGSIAFDDGVGEVSGTWRLDRKPATQIFLLLYIMVDNAEDAIKLVLENRGKIVQPIGKDFPEITAHFSDPAGNVLGIYQEIH